MHMTFYVVVRVMFAKLVTILETLAVEIYLTLILALRFGQGQIYMLRIYYSKTITRRRASIVM